MRINDILAEQQLDEKPMGFLSKLGNKAAAALGSKKAQGKLDAGAEANRMSDAFYTYIGQTGQEATPEVVIDFLQKNGYPTASAEKIMGQKTTAQKAGEKVGKAAVGVKNAVKGVAKTAGAGAQQTKQGPQAGANPPIAGKVTKQTVNNNPPINTAAAAKPATAPANMQAKSTQDLAKKATPAAPAATTPQAPNPSAQQPTTAKPSTGGVKIAGAKKKPAGNVKPAMQTAGTDFDDEFVLLEDGTLSRSQLSKIFMAATQDAIKRDMGGQNITGTGKADNAQTGGFLGGVKQGAADAQAQADAEDELDAAGGETEPATDIKPGTPVAFISKSGKATQATVAGPSEDGDPNKVSINSGKQNYNISKDKLLDPKTQKPISQSGTAATPAPEPEQTDQDQAVGTAPEQSKELPAEIKQQLDALSDAQRKRLAGMLQ